MLAKIGVLIAAREEAAAILANAAYQWHAQGGGIYRSAARRLALAVCGPGKANAAFALGQLFAEAAEFVLFGTSGSLGQDRPGALYLCTEFIEYDMLSGLPGVPPGVTPFSGMTSPVISGGGTPIADRIQEACRAEKLELHGGRALSGDQFIQDRELALARAAEFGGQLCDMESAAAAKICLLRHKPFCTVRCVTDSADSGARLSWQTNVRTAAGYFDRILARL